jgi:hypothetical protein
MYGVEKQYEMHEIESPGYAGQNMWRVYVRIYAR